MDDIEVLLDSWGLRSELAQSFKDNVIKDLATLGELLNSQDDFATVVPCIGTRMKLKTLYKQHVSSDAAQPDHLNNSEQQIIFADNQIVDIQPGYTTYNTLDGISIGTIFQDERVPIDENVLIAKDPFETLTAEAVKTPALQITSDVNNVRAHTSSSVEDTPVAKKSRYRNVLDVDVREILNEHPLGPSIITIYNHTQELDTQCQSYVCDIIILHFLKAGPSSPLTNEDFEQLAEKIVEVFPNECQETYYVPPVKKKDSKHNKSGISKGKLVDKYRNKSTFIRKAKNLAGKLPSEDTTEAESTEERTSAEKSKNWLLHNRDEKELLKHWTASYSLRAADCQNASYGSLAAIFDQWPILKGGKGYELIDRDFQTKYPDSKDSLIDGWETFFEKILLIHKKQLTEASHVHTELLESGDLTIDSRTAVQLNLLPVLVAPKSNKISIPVPNTGNRKTFWKPSIVECREGFFVQVKVPGDIQNVVREKREKMLKMKLTLQPFVIAVAPDITTIAKVYVSIDEIIYEVPSVLKGIDLLFKTCLAFEAKYPLECEHICYLIQWGVYNIHTKSDNKIPFVYTTLNKVKKLKSASS